MRRSFKGQAQRLRVVRVCLAALILAVGCGSSSESSSQGVAVAIPPYGYLLRRICGQRIEVVVLLPPGQSPATYDPGPKQAALLAQKTLYLKTSLPCERRFAKLLASGRKTLKVVDLCEGMPLRSLRSDSPGFSHDNSGAREVPDPHLWLDPVLVRQQCRRACDALCRIDPSGRSVYRARCETLCRELGDLHEELDRLVRPFAGRCFFVVHPAFGYFADRYHLRQIALEHEGKEPSARYLAGIASRARREGARALLVQKQFAQAPAERIAEAVGLRLIAVDPLGEDYFGMMREVAQRILEALAAPLREEK